MNKFFFSALFVFFLVASISYAAGSPTQGAVCSENTELIAKLASEPSSNVNLKLREPSAIPSQQIPPVLSPTSDGLTPIQPNTKTDVVDNGNKITTFNSDGSAKSVSYVSSSNVNLGTINARLDSDLEIGTTGTGAAARPILKWDGHDATVSTDGNLLSRVDNNGFSRAQGDSVITQDENTFSITQYGADGEVDTKGITLVLPTDGDVKKNNDASLLAIKNNQIPNNGFAELKGFDGSSTKIYSPTSKATKAGVDGTIAWEWTSGDGTLVRTQMKDTSNPPKLLGFVEEVRSCTSSGSCFVTRRTTENPDGSFNVEYPSYSFDSVQSSVFTVTNVLSSIAERTQDLRLIGYWLDKSGEGNRFLFKDNEFVNGVKEPFISNICTQWTRKEGAPSTIALGRDGLASAHIEGERLTGARDETGVQQYIYKITFGVNPSTISSAQAKEKGENIEFEVLIDDQPLPLNVKNQATYRITRPANSGEMRVDGTNMIIRQSPTIYNRICLRFTDLNKLDGKFKSFLNGNQLCNKLTEYQWENIDLPKDEANVLFQTLTFRFNTGSGGSNTDNSQSAGSGSSGEVAN